MRPRIITWNGRSLSLTGWAAELGMSRQTLVNALERGRTFEEIATNGKQYASHRYTFRGETRTLSDWCARLDIPYPTAWMRLRAGWTIDRVLGRGVMAKAQASQAAIELPRSSASLDRLAALKAAAQRVGQKGVEDHAVR